MADDIVYITFDNDKIGANIQGTTPQNNAYLNGTLTFDYTTNQVTGQYQITGDISANRGISVGGAITQQNGTITFSDGNLSLNFTGEQPSQANLITYKINSSDPFPQYSSTDEPTPLLTSSTTAPCYCAGTLIRTVEGEVAVESLRLGDLVLTASGEHRPIRWLGTRSYIGRFANRNPDVLPICFKAGSLADTMPARDLWVSPKHAMFLDGALVPAELLVNGVSVIKAARVDRLDYYHVELDSHDVLLAEGAPSESFVDDNGREIFHNAREHAALYPDAVRTDAVYCAPRLEEGHALETIRQRIAMRARMMASADVDALAG